jgi:hypothetical protein
MKSFGFDVVIVACGVPLFPVAICCDCIVVGSKILSVLAPETPHATTEKASLLVPDKVREMV